MMPRAMNPARAGRAPQDYRTRLALPRTCAAEVDCMLLPTFVTGRKPASNYLRLGPGNLYLRVSAWAYQVPHFSRGSGSGGGVRKAGVLVKSSALSGVLAAASRAVSGGRFHFSSTSLSTDVWSRTSEQT